MMVYSVVSYRVGGLKQHTEPTTDREQRLRSIYSLATAIINAQFDDNATKEAIRRIRGLSGGCKDGD